jgi:uncharacterized protein (DUF2141 family)
MNTFGATVHLLISLAAGNRCGNVKEQAVPVMITGLQSGSGQIILNIFKDSDSYKEQKPFRQVAFDKSLVKNGFLNVNISLQTGTYGITLMDGEKGFGFSNFYGKKMERPAFDDIKIVVKNENDIFDSTIPVDIRVKYM